MKNFLTLKSLANLFRPDTYHNKVGSLPGTILYTGTEEVEKSFFKVLSYSPQKFREETVNEVNDIPENMKLVSFFGIQDVEKMKLIGERYNIHNLALEDIANSSHSLKFEEQEDMLLVILKVPVKAGAEYSHFDHIGLILKENCILTFHETTFDPFESIRDRMRKGVGKIRHRRIDFLYYLLIDQIIDRYFPLLDAIESQMFDIDKSVSEFKAREGIERIQSLRVILNDFYKLISPLNEVSTSLIKSDTELMEDDVDRYLRDLQDQTFTIVNSVRSLSDRMNSLMDLLLSVNSFRLNESMKTLTIVATIFMPLTFIAGVYGMNFKYMPELEHPYGYFYTLLGMGILAAGMCIYLKIKK